MQMVDLRQASKFYGVTIALDGVDLTIAEGRTTILLGPSGCGKSTVLRLIAGLIGPSSGEVLLDGLSLATRDLYAVRRQIGFVIQEGGLFPHLTAEGNILLLARHLGRSAAELADRLKELCELTRFPASALDRYPIQLSGGQRQRVALMRALFLEPRLLLLDEPLGALDPMVRAGLQNDLKAIFQRVRPTSVFVTHDLAEAIFLGDEIVLMNEGRIVQKGTWHDLRERPAAPFVTEFLNAQRGTLST